jgi:hypothetical protein
MINRKASTFESILSFFILTGAIAFVLSGFAGQILFSSLSNSSYIFDELDVVSITADISSSISFILSAYESIAFYLFSNLALSTSFLASS